ncbi:MAG: glycoside hydrolase family 97 catalytic domain-containing protein [Oscillospiraceae bacterium]|jgi:regulation of enolase protein 1 (concanavalin A-like superfamily)|nr:glycoside hydrolase family 97 catalytic domain-containing protein [Oscillospiraceae bacterium]
MHVSKKRILSALLAAIMLFSCFSMGALAAPIVAVRVDNPPFEFLEIGKQYQFTATVKPVDAEGLTWNVCQEDGLTPSDKAVIDETGLLTALSGGYITVVASDPAKAVRSAYLMFILDTSKVYNILSKRTSSALTANTAGTGVTVAANTDSAAQQWKIHLSPEGHMSFQNVGTGGFINATGDSSLSLAEYADTASQRFSVSGKVEYGVSNYTSLNDDLPLVELGAFRFTSMSNPGRVFSGSSGTLSMAALAIEDSYTEQRSAQKYTFVESGVPAVSLEGLRKTAKVVATFGTSPYSASSTFDKAFDGSTSTVFDSSNGAGYAGIELAEPTVVTAARFYPRSNYNIRAFRGVIQGSNSKESGYVDLYEFNATPFSTAWTTVSINNTTAYRFYRYASPPYGYTNVAEIEFYEPDIEEAKTDVQIAAPDFLTVGQSYDLTVSLSPEDAFTPIWGVYQEDGYTATNKASIDSGTGRLTALETGYVTVVVTDPEKTARGSYLLFILDPQKTYQIVSKQSGQALAANETGDGVALLAASADSPAQQWAVHVSESGLVFKNTENGKFIQPSGNGLVLAEEASDAAQRFGVVSKIPYTASNYTQFGSVTELGAFKFERDGAVLTADGGALLLAPPIAEDSVTEQGAQQKWTFVPVGSPAFSLEGLVKLPVIESFGGYGDPYSASNAVGAAFDGDTNTFFDNKYNIGYAGIQLEQPRELKAVRFFARAGFNIRAFKGYIEGSDDGVRFDKLYELNAAPTSAGWTQFYVNTGKPYRYYRYISPDYGYGNVAEVEFYAEADPLEAALISETVTSPDGQISFRLTLNHYGVPKYSVVRDGAEVIEESGLGFVTRDESYTGDLVYAGKEDNYVDAVFHMVSGKSSTIRNNYNETTFRFTKNGKPFGIRVRAYDDGVGFKYLLDGSGSAVASAEKTSFKLPPGSVTWAMPYQAAHETLYVKRPVTSLSGSYIMPFLANVRDDTFALLLQSDLDSRYVGSQLTTRGMGLLNTTFVSQQGSAAVNLTLPFESPWRAIVIGSLKNVAESNLVQCLAPETTMDTSWIEPGVTAWTWYNNDSCRDFEVYKSYIDLAHEMGWKYILLDEGWQLGNNEGTVGGSNYYGVLPWIPDLIEYGRERGVGLLVWAHYRDMQGDKINRIREWAELGIKGTKVDFFNSEAQSVLAEIDRIREETAKWGLLLNLHGAVTPTGENRTYPHLLSREGVYGEEQKKWNSTTVSQDIILPFTRGVPGEVDYTPAYSTLFGRAGSRTYGYSTALTVVLENGIPCFADKPAVYRTAATYDFFRNIPAVWDESLFLGGYPEEYAAFARRSQENWYIGAITAAARTFTVDLDFLEAGTSYYASIYTDGATRTDVNIDYRRVSKGDTIDLPMLTSGGAVVKLTKQAPKLPKNVTVSPSALSVDLGKTARFDAAVDTSDGIPDITKFIWAAEDPEIAEVSATGVVTGKKPGRTAISLMSPAGAVATAYVTVEPGFVLNDSWRVLRGNSNAAVLSPTSLEISTEPGDLWQMRNNAGTVNNIYLTDVENTADGSFTVTAELTFRPTVNYQTAGIAVYLGDGNFVSILRRYHSGGSPFNCVMSVMNTNSSATNPATPTSSSENRYADVATEKIYLKLEKVGSSITGYYSANGETWTPTVARTNALLTNAPVLGVGFYAANGNVSTSIPAVFENFRLNDTLIPFSENVIAAAAEESILTSVGVAPTLPAAVQVKYSDKSEDTAAVIWDSYDPALLDTPGVFVVEGTIDGTNNVRAKARVTVLPPTLTASLTLSSPEPGRARVDAELLNGGAPVSYFLILAFYDASGRLAGTEVSAGISETLSAQASLEAAWPEDCTARAFLWDANFQPIQTVNS